MPLTHLADELRLNIQLESAMKPSTIVRRQLSVDEVDGMKRLFRIKIELIEDRVSQAIDKAMKSSRHSARDGALLITAKLVSETPQDRP